MERIAIVECGPGSVGKTSTVKRVYAKLCDAYPDAEVLDLHARPRHAPDAYKDIIVVVTIHGTRVGLLSQGDPQKVGVVRETLQTFVEMGCDVIVCAARGRGNTLEEVRRLNDSAYTVIERRREWEPAKARDAANEAEAAWIIERIDEVVAGAAAS